MIAVMAIALTLQAIGTPPEERDPSVPKDWPGPGETYYAKLHNPGPLFIVRPECDGYFEIKPLVDAYYRRLERYEADFRAALGRDPSIGPIYDITNWEYNRCDDSKTLSDLGWARVALSKAEGELRRFKRNKVN